MALWLAVMDKYTKPKQENTISTECLHKYHLPFCTWSTTDHVPLPVTHPKYSYIYQEVIYLTKKKDKSAKFDISLLNACT